MDPVKVQTDTDFFTLMAGLLILAPYDDTGRQISLDHVYSLYAGPRGQENLDAIPHRDIEELQRLGWYFEPGVGRWGWHK